MPSFTRLGPGERPDHYRTFNARCETLAEKPIFSRLLLHGRRCGRRDPCRLRADQLILACYCAEAGFHVRE